MATTDGSYRLFTCARPECHALVCLCRSCDRGDHYCSEGCSKQARVISLRRSSALYQLSEVGRANHKARQQRLLIRRDEKKMTQQGPPPALETPPSGSMVTADAAVVAKLAPVTPEDSHDGTNDTASAARPFAGHISPAAPRCTRCGRPCGPFARVGRTFVRHPPRSSQRGPRLPGFR